MKTYEVVTAVIIISLLIPLIAPLFEDTPPPPVEMCRMNIGTETNPVLKWVACNKVPPNLIVVDNI